jgi:hypothetical protein
MILKATRRHCKDEKSVLESNFIQTFQGIRQKLNCCDTLPGVGGVAEKIQCLAGSALGAPFSNSWVAFHNKLWHFDGLCAGLWEQERIAEMLNSCLCNTVFSHTC